MSLNIKGINTGVIRQQNRFIALALKIRQPRNKECLFFFPLLSLKDLLLCIENRFYLRAQLDEKSKEKFDKASEAAIQKMNEEIPSFTEDELRNADVGLRVNAVTLQEESEKGLIIDLALQRGDTVSLNIDDVQMPLIARAIIQAINNAEMPAIIESASSILDFLPLYDADCLPDGDIEFDTYQHPQWKHGLFNCYLAVLYKYQDEQGQDRTCGSVIKTRTPSESEQTQSISQRLLRFSPRLRKLQKQSCQVYVRTLTADKAARLTQDQCLRALHQLRVQSVDTAA